MQVQQLKPHRTRQGDRLEAHRHCPQILSPAQYTGDLLCVSLPPVKPQMAARLLRRGGGNVRIISRGLRMNRQPSEGSSRRTPAPESVGQTSCTRPLRPGCRQRQETLPVQQGSKPVRRERRTPGDGARRSQRWQQPCLPSGAAQDVFPFFPLHASAVFVVERAWASPCPLQPTTISAHAQLGRGGSPNGHNAQSMNAGHTQG